MKGRRDVNHRPVQGDICEITHSLLVIGHNERMTALLEHVGDAELVLDGPQQTRLLLSEFLTTTASDQMLIQLNVAPDAV